MKMLRVALIGTIVAVLSLTALVAYALEFTPTAEFALSDTKVKANPEINIKVSQDSGEEELAHVTLSIPKGFKLPPDAKIPDGTDLGTADITIDAGPRCAGQGPVSGPATFPDRRIYEQDRTDEQADSGVHAVWVVDLRPVTTIPLTITGNVTRGWKLDGDIPANAFTCPPFTFEATIFATAGEQKILKNTAVPGTYAFKATFLSQDSPATLTQKTMITITP